MYSYSREIKEPQGGVCMHNWEGLSEEQVQILQQSRQRVIESIGKNMDLYGITSSIGYMYGTMFFENKPTTLDEMGEAMGMSKTSMSTGMRTLIDLKMVHKVWGKGSRKDLYEVETNWYQTFSDYFVVKWRKSLEINLQTLKKTVIDLDKILQDDPSNEQLADIVKIDKRKVTEAISYYLWLDRLINTFESGEIFDLVPKV